MDRHLIKTDLCYSILLSLRQKPPNEKKKTIVKRKAPLSLRQVKYIKKNNQITDGLNLEQKEIRTGRLVVKKKRKKEKRKQISLI